MRPLPVINVLLHHVVQQTVLRPNALRRVLLLRLSVRWLSVLRHVMLLLSVLWHIVLRHVLLHGLSMLRHVILLLSVPGGGHHGRVVKVQASEVLDQGSIP
jgi:hypothetical protein